MNSRLTGTSELCFPGHANPPPTSPPPPPGPPHTAGGGGDANDPPGAHKQLLFIFHSKVPGGAYLRGLAPCYQMGMQMLREPEKIAVAKHTDICLLISLSHPNPGDRTQPPSQILAAGTDRRAEPWGSLCWAGGAGRSLSCWRCLDVRGRWWL